MARTPVPLAAALLMLSGCAEPAPPPPQRNAPISVSDPKMTGGGALEQITLSVSSCYGPCPVYTVTVASNGNAIWEGQKNVAYIGKRPFTVTPDQFRMLTARIDKWRPMRRLDMGGGSPVCTMAVTDLATTRIVWSGPDANRNDELILYHGCDMTGKGTMREDIIGAPALLPIAAFIGAPSQPPA